MLKVLLLDDRAKAPTVAHPGEDLGYDLYALEDTLLTVGPTWVRTGIAVEDTDGRGFVVRDRSSMAGLGVFTHGGVIDAGYRGEIKLNMTIVQRSRPYGISEYRVQGGQKIAQMIPIIPCTSCIELVDKLGYSSRGENGFGSSGL